MKRNITLLVLLLSWTFGSAQNSEGVIRCNTDEIHAQKMLDPVYHEAFEEKIRKADAYLEANANSNRAECDNPLIIPVAVHFQDGGLDLACAIDMAVDQVNTMNLDFGGTNTDINLWNTAQASTFPGINNKESCIQFCLATLNHPAGYGLNDGDYAITIGATTGDDNADWTGYLNFWVRDLGGGLLGYSPLGGSGNGDGVVCTTSSFGSTSCGGNTVSPPYHLGRTMTHEVGHYLLLDHTFNGGCADDDSVADTPATAAATYGCPTVGDVSCTDPILWMSYMDYCDDLCLYMFSAGQVDRMEAFVNTNLQNLLNNSVTTCEEAACLGYSASTSYVDETCDGDDGAIVCDPDGGTGPYFYSINNGGSFTVDSVFSSLSEGIYNVIVRDDNDCEFIEEIVIVREEPDYTLVNKVNSFCGNFAGSIEVAVNETSAFQFSLDGTVWQDSPLFENLNFGTYDVLTINDVGCHGEMVVEVEDDNDLSLVVDEAKNVNCFHFDNGAIVFHVVGAQKPVSYTLDGFVSSEVPYFKDLSEGIHTIHVVDGRGCQEDLSFDVSHSYSTISEDCPCFIYVPNAMTPNNDGVNDYLTITPSCPVIDYKIEIYDKWGIKVFESFDTEEVWNGGGENNKDYYLMNDIYFYKINYSWGFTDDQTTGLSKIGTLSILR